LEIPIGTILAEIAMQHVFAKVRISSAPFRESVAGTARIIYRGDSVRERIARARFDQTQVTLLTGAGISIHLLLRYGTPAPAIAYLVPLYLVLAVGVVMMGADLFTRLRHGEFGADFLAAISVITSLLLGEYLVGTIVILMFAGGTALEQFATRRAAADLRVLAARAPQIAHRHTANGIEDLDLSGVAVGEKLIVLPHEICPVDGVVVEGHSHMDESLLTGEPFRVSKAPGTTVISGAINGESAIVVQASKVPSDSRYARIIRVISECETKRPHMRRIADRLGAWYTPFAVALAATGWIVSGDPYRFLAVLVIATPCPLILAIPVAIVGGISLAARRGIIIRDPLALERVDQCRTLIFDKTGTLTHGRPALVETICASDLSEDRAILLAASMEQYSKHPLAGGILRAATQRSLSLLSADKISELPGRGLEGQIDGSHLLITSRKALDPEMTARLPSLAGLECILLIDGRFGACFRFRDEARAESRSFIHHLKPRHRANKIILVSGDREIEVRYLAEVIGIPELYFGKTPEEKVSIVERETRQATTLFVGDGVNDAPAMLAATVGVAFGRSSDVTAETASAVVLENSLEKVDELIHIGRRMRHIALESAAAGMLLSMAGMIAASWGHLPPIGGVVAQEIIDVVAVLNALRVSVTRHPLTDYSNEKGYLP
jgi:heavy metal translocating P-type ATPase